MALTEETGPPACSAADGPLRIAMVAPPWIPVPPPRYGGIERVVALLTDALARRGHDVTLFAAPGSHSIARVRTLLPRAHGDALERALFEADHAALALQIAEDEGFDVLHDHCSAVSVALASRAVVPVVHTLHGPFDEDRCGFYAHHGHHAWLVAISAAQRDQAPDGVPVAAVVHNPTDIGAWPLRRRKDGYLLWMNRFSETKGAHRAIEVARRANRPLVLAGPVQPGQEEHFERDVAPHLDGSRVAYAGEVGGEAKGDLLAGAAALLMPIRWAEPFGMAMVEAMACGTPVLAFPEGAAPEVVEHGISGFLVEDEAAMAAAVGRLDEIDPLACRASAARRFDVDVAAAGYERVYRAAVAAARAEVTAAGPAGIR